MPFKKRTMPPNPRVQRTSTRDFAAVLAAESHSFGVLKKRLAVSLIGVVMISVTAAFAEKNAPSDLVPGLYENFRYVEEAGDVVGMGVFIVWSSNGLKSSFNALVQTAEGMPGTPVLVKVTVNGSDIEFSLPGDDGAVTVFKGTVSKKGLAGTFGDEKVMLKRVHRGFTW